MRLPSKNRQPVVRNTWQQLSLALALLTAGPAWAACSVSSTGLSFGPYQSLSFAGILTSANVVSTGDITITCSATAAPGSFTLALGPGTAGIGDRISTRYLANDNGGANMVFNIYTDSSRNIVWGKWHDGRADQRQHSRQRDGQPDPEGDGLRRDPRRSNHLEGRHFLRGHDRDPELQPLGAGPNSRTLQRVPVGQA